MSSLVAPQLSAARHSGPAPLRIEKVADYRAFLRLEPEWNRLVASARPDHPFLEHVWARTWWDCFGQAHRLNILVVRSGEDPVAIVPLMRSDARIWGVPVTRLGFLYNSHVPRADFLIADRRDEVYRAVWRHLAQDTGWDLLQLCQLPEDSPTLPAMETLAQEDGCATGAWTSGASPFVRVEKDWDRFFSTLPAKHRSNLRNRSKRLAAAGTVDVETIGQDGVPLCALEEGLRLESAAWKADAGTAILSDADVRTFYTMLARRTAELGWCRLHFLRASEKRIAFDFSLEYNNQSFLLKIGYDPAFAPYSPSNLLLLEQLRDAFARGLDRYDFLGESADWKRCWTRDARSNRWLFLYSDTFRGRLQHLLKFRVAPMLHDPRLEPLRRLALRLHMPAIFGRA